MNTAELMARAKAFRAGMSDDDLADGIGLLAKDYEAIQDTFPLPLGSGLNGGEGAALHRLIARTKIGVFLSKAVAGERLDTGSAEEELRTAVSAAERGIPLAAFERSLTKVDAATGSPSVSGINMARIVPSAFERSVMERIGVGMPMVPSGQFSTPTISTNPTAAAVAKGTAKDATEALFAVKSAKPRRITARIQTRIEDLAEAGIPAFESALRDVLLDVLADTIDMEALAGDGSAPHVNGLLNQLTPVSDPTDVVSFTSFLESAAGNLDGKWAARLEDVVILVNTESAQKLHATFQNPVIVEKGTNATAAGAGTPSTMTAAEWAEMKLGGFWTSSRMPAGSSNISKAVAYLSGREVVPREAAAMPAILPIWSNTIAIDDPYTGAASGLRNLTLHVLVGDRVILRQSDAFKELRFKTA